MGSDKVMGEKNLANVEQSAYILTFMSFLVRIRDIWGREKGEGKVTIH